MKEMPTARLSALGKNNSRQKDLLKKRKMLFDLENETDISADTDNTADEEFESYFRPREKNITPEVEDKETLPPKSKKKCMDKSDDNNESSEEELASGDFRIITFQLPETAEGSNEEVFYHLFVLLYREGKGNPAVGGTYYNFC